MPRHGCDDQEAWTVFAPFAAEMLELAERLPEEDFFIDPDLLARDPHALDTKPRLPARRGGMGEYL
jgi:hypothetical protein